MAVKTTQRAYTLRLTGTDRNDQTWRENLWRTHEAVNKGAKAFGDWLLTLRGGLDHKLANLPVVEGRGDNEKKRPPTPEEIHDRRVLLALSWLSVESQVGASEKYVVAEADDPRRSEKVIAALHDILAMHGLRKADVGAWETDCRDSLSAAIRDDAVWVNRSGLFDSRCGKLKDSDVWDFVGRFFDDAAAYLATKDSDEGSAAPKELAHQAGQWLSSRFGTGKGADFTRIARVCSRMAEWADRAKAGRSGEETIAALAEALSEHKPKTPDLAGVLGLVGGPGYKSGTRNLLKKLSESRGTTQADMDALRDKAQQDAEGCGGKVGGKGRRPYSDAILEDVERECGFTYLQNDGPSRHWQFAVVLDHAARRVSQTHSWVKLAEANRRRYTEEKAKLNAVPKDAREWLDQFCRERSLSSGAIAGYRIRRRAIDGWNEVVKAWAKKDCKTEADRIKAARDVEADPEMDKFGDIQLFEALASDDAFCIWRREGVPDPEILKAYVLAKDAEDRMRRYKVPAYRHPDPLLHPVFCDFGKSRWDICFEVHDRVQKLRKMKADLALITDDIEMAEARRLKRKKEMAAAEAELLKPEVSHLLSLQLWDGAAMVVTKLRWQSKRLPGDFALGAAAALPQTWLARADRAGRAAGNASPSDTPGILGLFEQEEWNGRLQVPRDQLEAIAGCKNATRKKRLVSRLEWLVTLSAELQPQGPWCDYAKAHGLKDDPKYWPHSDENKKRQGHAKLVLSRLPALRVLSVDLGHRYAAACAVWDTLPEKRVAKECEEAGRKPPAPDDVCLHLLHKLGGKSHKTIYRRTGEDMWARLDRQFTVKLQGEDGSARKALPAELKLVRGLEQALGRKRAKDDPVPQRVDELMSTAVFDLRRGLQRHGDRARIAFNLTADRRLLSGGRSEKLDAPGRVALLQETLSLWRSLFSSPNWQDEFAKAGWAEHIKPLLKATTLPEAPAEGAPRQAVKAYRRELPDSLKPVAEKLAANRQLRMKLHVFWATRWRADDAETRKRRREMRNWILPHGRAASDKTIRHVGGLSLTRLATIRGLWQVQKAYAMRPDPDDLRKNVPKKDESSERFGQRVLDALENMRENRVKQLASRIIEAAIGIGKELPKVNRKDQKRPRERVYPACHAVVIENLDNYRPDEIRTRRENRQLMQWSAGQVRKYLKESCQLYGLHLREVYAGYTSRQDSRTGAPGIRCADVPVTDFLKRLKPRVDDLRKKDDAESGFLVAAYDYWNGRPDIENKTVRVPRRGGDIFVSAERQSPAAMGIQADLNAAANIGLKALLDPDWPGKWWYVPCDATTHVPVPEKVKCGAADTSAALVPATAKKEDGKQHSRRKKAGDITNFWRDPSAAPIAPGDWKETTYYWNGVKSRVIADLRRQAGL